MNIREAADQIKRTVGMDEVLRLYGLSADRSGFMRCPFHSGDHTASLKIYNGQRGWTCFGCHAGGTVLDFVMRMDGVGFADAVKNIDTQLSLHLTDEAPRSFNSFFKKQDRQLELMRQFENAREMADVECEMYEGFLKDAISRYVEAYSTPKEERTAAQWRTIAEEEYYQPEELRHWQELLARKEMTYSEWASNGAVSGQ